MLTAVSAHFWSHSSLALAFPASLSTSTSKASPASVATRTNMGLPPKVHPLYSIVLPASVAINTSSPQTGRGVSTHRLALLVLALALSLLVAGPVSWLKAKAAIYPHVTRLLALRRDSRLLYVRILL